MSLSAANLSAQDVGFQYVLMGRTWRWKTRMDLSGATPSFQVLDIITPFGVLRDSVPLPGDIVRAMSDSIAQLVANFKPLILVGPPSSLTFTVDEGRGFSASQVGVIENIGVFGSLLNGSLNSSAPYIRTEPSLIGHLASNQSGSFDVMVDSTDLLSSLSPYTGSITVQDVSAPNSPQTLPLTIVVRPKAIIATTPTILSFSVTRPLSGPFPSITSMVFDVQNVGPSGSSLDFQVARLTGLSTNWLASFTPVTGVLSSSGSLPVTVNVVPVTGLLPGTYEETLRVSGYSANDYVDVLIRLVVT